MLRVQIHYQLPNANTYVMYFSLRYYICLIQYFIYYLRVAESSENSK